MDGKGSLWQIRIPPWEPNVTNLDGMMRLVLRLPHPVAEELLTFMLTAYQADLTLDYPDPGVYIKGMYIHRVK